MYGPILWLDPPVIVNHDVDVHAVRGWCRDQVRR